MVFKDLDEKKFEDKIKSLLAGLIKMNYDCNIAEDMSYEK